MGAADRPRPSWEQRQPSSDREAFSFEFWSGDGSVAGFACLTLWPGRAWYWAGLVGDGRPYVIVTELDAPPPRGASALDIRAEALWADHVCEAPFDHWSIGLEAFGLAFDDVDEAARSDRGDRTGLGFDLGWRAEPTTVIGSAHDYRQRGRVEGEILVGSSGAVETMVFDGFGSRRHWLGGGPELRAQAGGAPRLSAPVRLGTGVLHQRLVDAGSGWDWEAWLA